MSVTEALSLSRFEALVAAYGAEPRRWPEEEREAALALLRTDARAVPLLEQAGDVDASLGRYTIAGPSAVLSRAVVSGAPTKPLRHRLKLGWAALALALSGGGGVLAGTTAAMFALPDGGAVSIWDRGETTSFGDPIASED